MPFVAIPSTLKLLIRGVSDNQPVYNVLHYKYTGTAPASAAIITFLNSWLTAHQVQWLACHGPNYTLVGLDGTDISTPTGGFGTVTVAGPSNVGTMTGGAVPNNVALAVSWRTGFVGRRNRGRTFIGGLSTSAMTADTANSPFLSSLNSLALALIGQTFTGGYDLSVASRKDAIARAVTGFVLDAIFDSMRRRLPGRGA